jgi:hypothetical protein
MLFKEEISINVAMMDEAWEVCLEENAKKFPCIIVVPMEEDQEASSEKNNKILTVQKKVFHQQLLKVMNRWKR